MRCWQCGGDKVQGVCPNCGYYPVRNGTCWTCGYGVPKEDDIMREVDFGEEDHYEKGEIECVDYLWDNMPFEAFVGGAEWAIKKYLHRWRYKENPVKDLRKARDYLSLLIDVMEGKEPEFKEWRK